MTEAPIRIDIAVCTFRRSHLARTLESIAAIVVPPHADIRVLVADNDDVPSATALVETARSTMPFPILHLHCPASNISLARNACLDAGRDADYLAFVDDDEIVSPPGCASSSLPPRPPGPMQCSDRSAPATAPICRPG